MLAREMPTKRVRRPSSPALAAALVATLACVGACNRGRVVDSSLPRTSPAARTADSFVHCIETGTTVCVAAGQLGGGWDALHILLWLADGSPVAILEALPRELAAHTDPLRVQAKLVAEVDRYGAALRGAECQSVATRPLPGLVDQAADLATKRLQRLGLWRKELETVVRGLQQEAHDDLDEGHLVRIDCSYDPYRVYLVTRPHEGRIHVVGMTTVLAPAFGGDVLDRRSVQARLSGPSLGLGGTQANIQEDTIDTWLRFPLEEL